MSWFARAGSRRLLRICSGWGDSLVLLGVLAALLALFGVLSQHFLTTSMLATVGNQIPSLTIVAVGMTWVLIVGGIDLSVGSVMALTGAVFGYLVRSAEWPAMTAAVAALSCAAMCGAFNGWIVVGCAVPSFIVTLGMMEVARGSAYLVTGSQTVYLGKQLEWLVERFGRDGVSAAFLLAVGIVAACQVMLRRTVFGRHCIAAGDNAAALRLSGVDPRRATWIVFVMSALLSGVAGIIESARLSIADPNAGTGMELLAIAAVVIGGTSLTGGRGSVARSFLGVLIIIVLQTGLAQIGASDPLKRVITGLVIVLAVIGDAWRRRGK